MRKPHILYLLWNTKENGGNRIIFEHVNRLNDRGYKITIMSCFGTKPKWFLLKTDVQNILQLLLIKNQDIIIATFWPSVFLANLKNIKRKIYFVQGWEEDLYKNKILRMIAKYAHNFNFEKIVVSSFVLDQINKKTQIKLPVYYVPCIAIDQSVFFPAKKTKGNNTDKYILSVISHYSWTKGVDTLITLIKKLKLKHANYRFLLVSYEKKTPSSFIDEFYSNIDQALLAKLYRKSDALLVTSRVEGFFLPGLEAMSSGCPVITTDCGGINEYAKNSYNAIIVKHASSIWKENILENLFSNKKNLQAIKKNAKNTASLYTWSRVIDNLDKIFLSKSI